MKDIAHRLWQVRREMVNVRFSKQLATTDLGVREAELTLSAEGKNAEERKARAVVLAREDAEYQEIRRRLSDATTALEQLEAEEKFLEDTRRAQEWDVRLKMAAALSGRSIASDGSDPDAQEALDDALPDAQANARYRSIRQAPNTAVRPIASGAPLADDYLNDISPPRPTWKMPEATIPTTWPQGRNAPVLISDDDDVPF